MRLISTLRYRELTVEDRNVLFPSIQLIIHSLTHVDHLSGGLLWIVNKKRYDTTWCHINTLKGLIKTVITLSIQVVLNLFLFVSLKYPLK